MYNIPMFYGAYSTGRMAYQKIKNEVIRLLPKKYYSQMVVDTIFTKLPKYYGEIDTPTYRSTPAWLPREYRLRDKKTGRLMQCSKGERYTVMMFHSIALKEMYHMLPAFMIALFTDCLLNNFTYVEENTWGPRQGRLYCVLKTEEGEKAYEHEDWERAILRESFEELANGDWAFFDENRYQFSPIPDLDWKCLLPQNINATFETAPKVLKRNPYKDETDYAETIINTIGAYLSELQMEYWHCAEEDEYINNRDEYVESEEYINYIRECQKEFATVFRDEEC